MSDTRTTEASGEKLPPDQREVCHLVESQSPQGHLFIQRKPEDTVSFLNTHSLRCSPQLRDPNCVRATARSHIEALLVRVPVLYLKLTNI